MPGLIPYFYNNLTDDTLGSDEQFSVKKYFFLSFIFEISKILYLNPKSLNSYSLWLINQFSIGLVKRESPNEKILYFTTENFTLLQKTLLHEKYFFRKTWANLNSF